MSKNIRTWKFAVTTQDGIYHGELIGELEPHETDAQAMQEVSHVVRQFLESTLRPHFVLACFVTEGELHIDAPDTTLYPLDLQGTFTPEKEEE